MLAYIDHIIISMLNTKKRSQKKIPFLLKKMHVNYVCYLLTTLDMYIALVGFCISPWHHAWLVPYKTYPILMHHSVLQ